MSHTTRYRYTLDDTIIDGERIPEFVTLTFTEDDGTTAKDVSTYKFAASASNGTVSLDMDVDTTDAATGVIVVSCDATGATVVPSSYGWDFVTVEGPTTATDPIDVSIGGVITVQPRVTGVPA